MSSLREITEKINEFDKIITERFQRDVLAVCNAQIQAASDKVQEFNDWNKSSNETLQPEKADLDRRFAELKALEKEVTDTDRRLFQKPNPTDPDAVAQHNKRILDYQDLTARHRVLTSEYMHRQELFNQRVKDHTREIERRERELAAVNETARAAERTWERYRFWLNEKGPEKFHRELGWAYAALHEMQPRAGENAGVVDALIGKIRQVRRQLFEYACQEETKKPHGCLIAEVVVGGVEAHRKETCYLLVDNACTAITLSPALVRVLGLSDRLGDEVEIRLAGGQTARGRQLILPSVAVHGKQTADVRGIQLEETQPGVDGALGLSFLDRFEWTITGNPVELRLRPKGEPADKYDVFISFNSADEWWARVVCDALTVMNYRTFLSANESGKLAEAEFSAAINDAIKSSRHMVVVTSAAVNLETSKWVNYEVNAFHTLQMNGKKSGRLCTVLCAKMDPHQLVLPLESHQAFDIFVPDFRERLRKSLPLT
jgi:TIR domain